MSVYGSQPIDDIPEYINYTYTFNIFDVFLVVTGAYSVLFSFVTLKMIKFYYENKNSDAWKSVLRPDVFRVFLLMQFWNVFHAFMDFFVVRIPLTGYFTSWCAKENPEFILKTISLIFTGSVYSSHMLTSLFCIQRVLLLYVYGKRKEKVSQFFKILCPIVIIGGHLLGLPHFFVPNHCFQMAEPFPFGAVVVTSVILSKNNTSYAIIYTIFTQTMIATIVASTALMFAKLQQKRKSSVELQTNYNSTAETTLTATMILILLPIVVPSLLSIIKLIDYTYYPYLFPLRSICLDARAHIVSCYFYFTHPIFKRKTKIDNRKVVWSSESSI